MDGINFTANGTRWRAVPITSKDVRTGHVPALPGTGVLFTSADGEMRFLAMEASAVPALEQLKTKGSSELGEMAHLAKPTSR
jgi:hypothetical protein